MTIFNDSNTVARHTRHLAIALLPVIILLSGCQSEDSISTADKKNNSITSQEAVFEDKNAVSTASGHSCDNVTVIQAFKAQQSERQVQGCGTIIKALPDDNKGSRHQKILIELDGIRPRQSILLVHNIDLAPRVAKVTKGTALKFYGEYVYNDKGGLVHWTHHDPAARHQGGWIESSGVRYQ